MAVLERFRMAARMRRVGAAVLTSVLLCATSLLGARSAQAGTPTGVAKYVFAEMNRERAAHHVKALHWSVRLTSSSHSHNAQMVRYDTLSHQLGHESALGDRISHTTFPWRMCGENVGWNSVRSTSGALALQRMMYNEAAPYNGHRLNILNKRFDYVGIDVRVDNAHHKLWLTTDFAATT